MTIQPEKHKFALVQRLLKVSLVAQLYQKFLGSRPQLDTKFDGVANPCNTTTFDSRLVNKDRSFVRQTIVNFELNVQF